MRIRVHPVLREFAGVFGRRGRQAYLVGGAVRDVLLGREASDWDVATDAHWEEVCRMFRRVVRTGVRHGTVTVLFRGRAIEVTTFRKDAGYADGRRPDSVSFAATIEEDLARRDFTMNAVAAELPGGRLVDPFGGVGDIRAPLIRCVGAARERFGEDGLRPLRALRFAAALGFPLDGALLEAIPASLGTCAKVSAERVRAEFEKIVASGRPRAALVPMAETGLLRLFLPELDACRGVEQKGMHRFDVFTHSLLALEYAAKRGYGFAVRLAALFHDIGKPVTRRPDERGIWTFHGHEKAGAELCAALMERLRFPNALIKEVTHLVREHMFHYEDCWSDAAVRRFIVRAGGDGQAGGGAGRAAGKAGGRAGNKAAGSEGRIAALFDLRRCDSFAFAAEEPPPDLLLAFQNRIDDVMARGRLLSLKDLAVSGHDLIAAGAAPGRGLGVILKRLLEAVMEDPALNTKEKLLELALKFRSV